MALPILTLASVFFLTIAWVVSAMLSTAQLLPPGPKPLPLIGNLLDYPTNRQHAAFRSFAQQYGDLFSLRVPGRIIIVINSHKLVKDLLEKIGPSFSDRPQVPFINMVGWRQNNVGWMGYGETWHEHRRLIDPVLRPSAITQYQHIQREHAVAAVLGILAMPDKGLAHLKHFAASVIMAVVYGYDIKGLDDDFIRRAEDHGKYSGYASPASLPVNRIPFLRYLPSWMPGGEFHTIVKAAKTTTEEMINLPFAFVKEGLRTGTARPSLVGEILRDSQEAHNERAIAEVFSVAYSASVDSTAITLSGFLLVLCLYPAVQRRAQDEIDKVVGRDRLPNYSDRASLPYVEAICQELVRWRQALPIGGRATSEDVFYEGYHIPKGATVMVNTWAMLHDPGVYPDPEFFKPERYMTSDNKFIEDGMVSGAFGYGKRKCPGRHFADATVWIFVVSLLASCDLSDAHDERGETFPQDVQYLDGMISHPPPFTFKIVPRHGKAEEMLRVERAAVSD